MKFLHDQRLGQLFGLAVALVLIFPVLNHYLVYPKYQAQTLETVKDEAMQVAHHLSHQIRMDASHLRVELNPEAERFLLNDFGLLEIQILDQAGRVVYATDPKDFRKVYDQDFFWRELVQGREQAKVVAKGDATSAGEILDRDILEIYAPIMIEGTFVGACGLYYDISTQQREFNRIYLASLAYPLPLVLIFFGLVGFILKRLDGKILERQHDKEEIEAQRNVLLLEQKRHGELITSIETAKRQWEGTMDRVDDMVIMADPELRIRRCNKALCDFSGLVFTEILNKRLSDLFAGLEMEQGLANSGKPFEYFHEASHRWLYMTFYMTGETVAEEGWVVTVHDLTEMKTITAELERKNLDILETSEELQHAVDEISALIRRVIEAEEFEIRFTHDFPMKCYEAMSCDRKECPRYGKEAGSCWDEAGTFCGGEVQGEFAQKYESCTQCKYFKRMTANPINMIGEQFNNMMHILAGKNKELQAAYTELKQAESHLLQQEKMASIGQLAAGVAHEINNPVGFITSNLGSLRKYAARLAEYIKRTDDLVREAGGPELSVRLAEEQKQSKLNLILADIDDLVRESLEGCDRVKKIVFDLKTFSRVDQAQEQTVDIHECIDSTINIVWNELKYKAKIEKEYRITNPIRCFPQQLNQVFMNLLVNAAHAIEKEGTITIKTWQDEGAAYIAIHDTGCGIKSENLGHVFEPFFTTKEVGKGTGLGLSIVYDIVTKNHHGDIQVESQVGQGTTFTVKIPFGMVIGRPGRQDA